MFGYLWGKIGYGAMLFATALNDDSMHVNFADPGRTAVFVALAREAMTVARSQGASPRGFNGFDPQAFDAQASDADAAACVAALADFTRDTAKTHSGIWRDLAVRKRPTEAPGFFPPVFARAREAGIATPVMARLCELIEDIEQGRRTQSLATFEELTALA